MSIEAFKKQLRAKGEGPGARWHRADFHIHMPGSSDYEYRGSDAVQQLGAAIDAARLSYAVILKHQEMPTRAELESLQSFCPNTTLIPGAEVNVLVDTLFKKVSKDHFFHCIVAVDPAQSRDYSFVIEQAKEEFTYRAGDYPAGFRSSISDLGRFFLEKDAFFVPAHLHQGKLPETSRSIDDIYEDDAFLSFLRDGTFTALEVRDVSTARFFSGNRTTNEGVAIPASVCIASSDAHHHAHLSLRNRSTWVRTEGRSFEELRAALSFPHRVALDSPSATHARIVGLHVVGNFIPECWLHLNEGLNALIGSKGSGKTALLECLRFVLATQVPGERREAVETHLRHILGPAGYVECLVATSDGAEALITRRMDSPARLTILTADGNPRTVAVSEGPGFPVSILGWHEIEAVADHASARISLLDRVDDPIKVRDLGSQISAQIERSRDLMPTLQRQIKRLDAALRVLWDLQKKRRTLAKLEQGALSQLQSDYEEFLLLEQQLLRVQQTALSSEASLPKRIRNDVTEGVGPPRAEGPASVGLQSLAAVNSSIDALARLEIASAQSIDEGLSATRSAAAAAASHLASLFDDFRDNIYTPRINQLPPEERDVLARQIQVLEETKALPLAEAQVTDLARCN